MSEFKEATGIYKPEGTEDVWGYKLGYLVVDADEVDDYVSKGWFKTPQEAIDAKNSVDTKSLPTREELAQKANGLNIKVDGRWTDKRLAEEIENANKG